MLDCETGVILDIHYSMEQSRYSQISWQLLKRNLDKVSVLTVDKGYGCSH